MKVWVLHSVGDLRYEEVERPTLTSGEVLVRIKAVGICGSDIPRIYKDGAHQMPLVIGHEFAGEVVESGERVGIFPLIPCGKCEACRNKMYEMCRQYSWHYVLDRLECGKIRPTELISHRYAPYDAWKGFEIMRDKSEEYIKIMVEYPD